MEKTKFSHFIGLIKQSVLLRFLGFSTLAFIFGCLLVSFGSNGGRFEGSNPLVYLKNFILGTLPSLEPLGLVILTPLLGFTWMIMTAAKVMRPIPCILVTAGIVWLASAIF